MLCPHRHPAAHQSLGPDRIENGKHAADAEPHEYVFLVLVVDVVLKAEKVNAVKRELNILGGRGESGLGRADCSILTERHKFVNPQNTHCHCSIFGAGAASIFRCGSVRVEVLRPSTRRAVRWRAAAGGGGRGDGGGGGGRRGKVPEWRVEFCGAEVALSAAALLGAPS